MNQPNLIKLYQKNGLTPGRIFEKKHRAHGGPGVADIPKKGACNKRVPPLFWCPYFLTSFLIHSVVTDLGRVMGMFVPRDMTAWAQTPRARETEKSTV